MKTYMQGLMLTALFFSLIFSSGCVTSEKKVEAIAPPPLTGVEQISSFRPEVAADQALEVVQNNPYDSRFFEQVFERLVRQCSSSKSPENADIIWNRFIVPLHNSGKVPPDLARNLWNEYFSMQFVSLPSHGQVREHCYRLSEIKRAIEKEYERKRIGFEVTNQGSADTHFLNAMYVYNTMWAACHDPDN